MRLALFQPDIPQNTGAILRLAGCLGVGVDIIEPCGFFLDDRRLRRAGLDYLAIASFERHRDWAAFRAARPQRLVLLTTQATRSHLEVDYRPDDLLLLGRESAGVPEAVHEAADARIRIPLVAAARSLNLATAAALVLGEALRQTEGFPVQP
ncbi:tRNA (cytidine/uridine-2'-O-)-methyltransferase [Tistlia consotensis]|uniref:tRNA (cytidine(34)-2'-O)-methyltransferase n=1 Tax=Tistlia consotensis USBA 355 TaxID=560819 RepID=A0A1Y6CBN6_9PROT|nr:tRNA (cytidine(34)-2'-O)-methyltransferase [Tistlia consotensis]SMF46496.1 tRNA (cytidine/uridine-2'-O-)-methyltransferase [Tistlia consotensis USBA 355]SNR78352.1 tRNA (cytidine/uridine-2'-O-)-methyltransferase [Tistlia consotensis]